MLLNTVHLVAIADNTKNYLFTLLSQHLIAILLAVLLLSFLYKVITFNNYVLHYPKEVSASVRYLPNQRLPPDYPNGWIPILESQKLQTNRSTEVKCLGTTFTVTRKSAKSLNDEKNENELETIIEVVEQNNNKVWQSVELNGAIFVWHNAEDEEPSWSLDAVNELPGWTYRGRTEHSLHCHPQEIPENGADIAHLNAIHVDSILFGSNLDTLHALAPYRFLSYSWNAQWSPSSPETPDSPHMSHIALTNQIKLFSWTLFGLTFKVRQIGPAYVELRFHSQTAFGEISGAFLQFVTPLAPLKTAIVHHLYTNSSLLAFLFSKFALYGEAKMLERDIQIWNRKAFLSKPYFAKSERSLVQYRRWYAQFYSEHSKRTVDIE